MIVMTDTLAREWNRAYFEARMEGYEIMEAVIMANGYCATLVHLLP